MTEQEISQILKDAVPGSPDMRNLAGRVRSGYRRRRLIQGTVAALVLAAVGVPVALQINAQREDPPIYATPSPAPSDQEPVPTPTPGPTDPTLEEALISDRVNSAVCEDAQGTVSEFPDALIPDKVVRVHLCSNDQEPVVPVFGAPEPIIMDVSDVIEAINGSPRVTDYGGCDATDDTVEYVAVLEYGDGRKLVVNTSTAACLPVVTDGEGSGRGDSLAFFEALRDRLLEQRQSYAYAFEGDENLCLKARSIITTSIHDMARGWACGVEPTSQSPDEGTIRTPLPDDLVARIVDEATSDAEPSEAHGLPLFSQTVLLQNLHGDPFTLYRWPNGTFHFRDGVPWLEWTPSESLAAELAPYFEGTRADTFPEPAPPELCMDPNLIEFQGPLSEASSAVACVVTDEEGVYATHDMPAEYFGGLTDELEASSTEVSRETEFDFSGNWLAVLNDQGNLRQLFITTDGQLVWDDQDNFEVRHTAKVTPALALWFEELRLDVGR